MPILTSDLPLDDPVSIVTGGRLTESGDPSLPGIATAGLLPYGPFGGTPPASSRPAFYIIDPGGNSIPVSASTTSIPMGFSTLTMRDGGQAVMTPAMLSQPANSPQDSSNLYAREDEVNQTFTGSDMRVLLELCDPVGNGAPKKKQLVELTTISVSIHRVKTPARACGFINPRGIARGTRTIGGTLVLTQFTVDLMYRFLYSGMGVRDLSKDSFYLKPDQLPPFDLTLLFSDEYGNASYRRLLGVDCLTDGVVYSQNDMFTEQTISYLAADFTPLMPLNRSSLLKPSGIAGRQEKTPMQVMVKRLDRTLRGALTAKQADYIPAGLPANIAMSPSDVIPDLDED